MTRPTQGKPRFEVTCARCGFTKEWTQKMYDRHMWAVHGIRNEVHIGKDETKLPTRFHISP
jgi:hypothetical protein